MFNLTFYFSFFIIYTLQNQFFKVKSNLFIIYLLMCFFQEIDAFKPLLFSHLKNRNASKFFKVEFLLRDKESINFL